MNVLSLFDGISCGQIALNRIGVKPEKYYAAEIDKYAIKVTQANYPDTIQLGDVTQWNEWDIDWSSIDLVCGGFPCQAWSMAGKQMGDKDERGKLFWVLLDIVKHVIDANPKAYYLIENVKMKKEFEAYITLHTEAALGKVEKHLINSALVSAQNRNRYYWTNIQGIEQPKDKGIVLADILEDGGAGRQGVFCGAMRGRYVVDGKRQDHKQLTAGLTKQRIEVRYDGKTNALTTVTKDNNVVYGADGTPYYDVSGVNRIASAIDIKGHDYNKRIYDINGKAPTLAVASGGNLEPKILDGSMSYRKLTPVEYERLQTIQANYTDHVSKTQRYKMIGNAWTVDVIAHIFESMK